jgi:hypothetical protein
LHHVVVCVDQARHHDVATRVNHFVYLPEQFAQFSICVFAGWNDPFNSAILQQQRGVVHFGLGIVHGGDAAGTVDKQCRHAEDFNPRCGTIYRCTQFTLSCPSRNLTLKDF